MFQIGAYTIQYNTIPTIYAPNWTIYQYMLQFGAYNNNHGVYCIVNSDTDENCWQLNPTQVKCTCNANDSTYILYGF